MLRKDLRVIQHIPGMGLDQDLPPPAVDLPVFPDDIRKDPPAHVKIAQWLRQHQYLILSALCQLPQQPVQVLDKKPDLPPSAAPPALPGEPRYTFYMDKGRRSYR